jgi:threonylcarbamoyladenosine tRNA methylthiotransferase MtaB
MKKIAFETLGCKLNFAETSAIAARITGYERVDFKQQADIYVINTCTVTANAEKKLRELTKQIKKRNPHAKIIAIGCYAQRDPESVVQIPTIDLVLGMAEKFKLNEFLPALEKGEINGIRNDIPPAEVDFLPAFSYGDRTRSFLKVQEGCDYICTYCIIPEARGKGRNPSIETLVEQAVEIARKGIKEIVITGVNIGTFKDESQGKTRNFFDLIKALEQVDGIERYRISSIEPNLLTDEIIDFVLLKSEKFLPHFHIPLQSGSNEILAKMKRRYRRELYAEKVFKIKNINPDAAVGVDVIVGFPGETEAHFQETYAFLKDLPVSYLHVFSYSDRPGTEASRLAGHVPKKEITRRSRLLRELSERKYLLFAESQLGKKQKVLFEKQNRDGQISGFTGNYIKIVHPYHPGLANQTVEVLLKKISSGAVEAEIVKEK